MTKREFMIQYVLNRAMAVTSSLGGSDAAETAEEAWETINELAPLVVCIGPGQDFPPPPPIPKEQLK